MTLDTILPRGEKPRQDLVAKPVRLVLFTLAYESGMGRVASELANAASDLGCTTLMIAPPMEHEPVVADRHIFPRPTDSGVRCRKLFSLVAVNITSAFLAWKLSARRSIFLMVHLHQTVPLSILAALFAKWRGACAVLNLHDFYPHAPRYPSGLRWLERWFYRAAYRCFDIIAAMTEQQVERLVEEARVERRRIVVVQHGPLPVRGISRRGLNSGATRILVLGTLRQNKCIAESLAAFVRLQRVRAVCLRIAGAPGREERTYWERCRTILAEVPEVELIDRFIEETEMGAILSDVDGILCPYRDFDSRSGVAVLALSNAIPLIATRSAIPEYLRNDTTVWTEVEEPVTVDSVTAALERFLDKDRKTRFDEAERARAALEAAALWPEAVRRTLELAGKIASRD